MCRRDGTIFVNAIVSVLQGGVGFFLKCYTISLNLCPLLPLPTFTQGCCGARIQSLGWKQAGTNSFVLPASTSSQREGAIQCISFSAQGQGVAQ